MVQFLQEGDLSDGGAGHTFCLPDNESDRQTGGRQREQVTHVSNLIFFKATMSLVSLHRALYTTP